MSSQPPHTSSLRILVVTVSHRGDDARILYRQIAALTGAGIRVVYIAPEPSAIRAGVERVVIRRAVGRRRVRAWWEAMRAIRASRGEVNLVLVHDLELVLPARVVARGLPVVWDVHEDLVASVADRSWIPRWMRPTARRAVAGLEFLARRNTMLLLAEHSYGERLGDWPVVPNSTSVPTSLASFAEEGPPRLVYVGRLSNSRGLGEMIEVGRELRGKCAVELIGAVDLGDRALLEKAVDDGCVRWLGYLPNSDALAMTEGALGGLSLLGDFPNFVGSMPTKIYEYLAHGVPAISTPLPLAKQVIEDSGAGFVVPYDDVDAVLAAVDELLISRDTRSTLGRRGYEWVAAHHDWNVDSEEFVQTLAGWVSQSRGE